MSAAADRRAGTPLVGAVEGQNLRRRRSAMPRVCSNSSGCCSRPSWPGYARVRTSCSKTCCCATNWPSSPVLLEPGRVHSFAPGRRRAAAYGCSKDKKKPIRSCESATAPGLGAEDGIRTRDPYLGKVMRYHCATSARRPLGYQRREGRPRSVNLAALPDRARTRRIPPPGPRRCATAAPLPLDEQ
jgi:hypothetical protein